MKDTQNKSKKDWALLVRHICDKLYPKAETITLVMDNLASHSAAALYETFESAEAKRLWDCLEYVFTPKHGSWLNMAEIELSILTKPCLNRIIDKINTVKAEVKARQNYRNNKKAKTKNGSSQLMKQGQDCTDYNRQFMIGMTPAISGISCFTRSIFQIGKISSL